jgi:hypothetical protein
LKSTNLTENFKKQIVNRTTGLLEKTYNRNHITKLCDTYEDALRYQVTHKAEVMPCESHFWIVNLHKEKKLSNGFNHIKDIIYLKQALKMYNKYKQLIQLNIKVVGIKTDALLYEDYNNATKRIRENFDMENKVGCHKIEIPKPLNDTIMTITENELIEFEEFEYEL